MSNQTAKSNPKNQSVMKLGYTNYPVPNIRSPLRPCLCTRNECEKYCYNYYQNDSTPNDTLMTNGNWFLEKNKNRSNIMLTHRCFSPRVLWKVIMVFDSEISPIYTESTHLTHAPIIFNRCYYCSEEVPEEIITVYNLYNLGSR